MTREQIHLVRTTWEPVAANPETAGVLFYGRLFELDRGLRALFQGDMGEQGRKLVTMIGVAVRALDRIESIVPAIQDLGRRHTGYGVKDRDYDTMGAALLWTLEAGLGAAFTPEVREAWAAVYRVIADTMKSTLRPEGAA